MRSWTRLDKETCTNLESALRLEWLETNGIGGFASSTVSGAHTRRFHGLLTASLPPPARRMLLLSKLEERLHIGDEAWDLSTNVYPGTVHPAGYLLLAEFSLSPFPVFTFANELFELRKTVLMVRGENTTLVRYELRRATGPAHLQIRPLIAVRDSDRLTEENRNLDPRFLITGNRLLLRPYSGVLPFQIAHNAVSVREEGCWYRSLQFSEEAEGGQVAQEDLFNPCSLLFELSVEMPAWLAASTRLGEFQTETATDLFELEQFRRRNLTFARRAKPRDNLEETLLRAADQFVVRLPGDRAGILAGYPWLSGSSRDALISLTGLTLVTGRWEEARRILISLARECRDGQIPDSFPGGPTEPAYDQEDTSLWFVYATDRYLRYTGDLYSVRTEFYEVVKRIVRARLEGTPSGFRMDGDGLLPTPQGGFSQPSRNIKAVEIQALWYGSLSTATFLAQCIEGTRAAREFSATARLTRRSFLREFWNSAEGCLYDSIRDGVPDPSVLPNQLLAVGLQDSMLEGEKARCVVRRIERDFLTLRGIRFPHGTEPFRRPVLRADSAPMGPAAVWPWPVGLYGAGYLRAYGRNDQTLRHVGSLLEHFWPHLGEAGVGSISEKFDDLSRHEPGGCPAHATAVAEVLRLYDEVVRSRPPAVRRS